MKRFGILFLCLLCALSLTSCDKCRKGHTYANGVYREVCGNYGYTLYACEVCGEAKKVMDEAITPHTFTETYADVACGEYAIIHCHCTNCGFDTEKTAEAPKAHTYVSAEVEGNCQLLPSLLYTCELCGDAYSEVIPGAAYGEHSWQTYYTVDKAATTSSSGEKSIHCEISGCTARRNITAIPPVQTDFPFVPMGGQ